MNRNLAPQILRCDAVIGTAAQHKQIADSAVSAADEKQRAADGAYASLTDRQAALTALAAEVSAAQSAYDGLRGEAVTLRGQADAAVQRSAQSAIAGSHAEHARNAYQTIDEIEDKFDQVGIDPEAAINIVIGPVDQELADAESLINAPLPVPAAAPSASTLPGTGAPGMPA